MIKDKDCMTCGGTGSVWLDNSWFMRDGQNRQRCAICAGTGKSPLHNFDSDFVRRQRDRRIGMTLTSPEQSLGTALKTRERAP